MSPGQMLPGQMLLRQLKSVQDSPRNLHLNLVKIGSVTAEILLTLSFSFLACLVWLARLARLVWLVRLG